MSKQCINVTTAPPVVAPYSHAVRTGNLLFISGQTPVTLEGKVLEGDFKAETRQCLENLKAIIEGAGSSMEKVVKVTGFLTTMDNFAAFNEVYKEYFTENFPSRSCVAVAQLPLNVRVEIEAIAEID
jgi:2-iminobutanoate/2-iminopropanoate deaminase